MPAIKAAHLTATQHREVARLLKQAQDSLLAASRIVDRALYTDRALYAAGTVQEWMIDPLRDAWYDGTRDGDNPYPSVGYGRRLRAVHRPRMP